MTIAQLIYPGLGGHSSVAFSLIEGDKQKKYNHSIIGYGIEDLNDVIKEKSIKLGFNVKSIKKKQGIDIKSLLKVYRALKDINPDKLIVHSTSLILVSWFYCKIYNVKFVSVEHQSNNAKTFKDWIYTFLILIFSKNIIYLTYEYLNEVKRKFRIFPFFKSIKVVPNGVSIENFESKSEKKKWNTQIQIAMISRLNHLRDHKTLIDAVKELSLKYNIKLIIAGNGPTFSLLKEYVKNSGCKKNISFTGMLKEDGLIDLLKKSDIYVHSSLAETQSTSLLQVMASRTPIIATKISGIENLLVSNTDALLFQPKNKMELCLKIEMLIKDFSLGKVLANNSFKKVKKYYNSDKMFLKYINILN